MKLDSKVKNGGQVSSSPQLGCSGCVIGCTNGCFTKCGFTCSNGCYGCSSCQTSCEHSSSS